MNDDLPGDIPPSEKASTRTRSNRASMWAGLLEWEPDGFYEAADTKLARTSKPAHILQLCFYTEQLARLTGREPAFLHVVLGSGLRDSYRPGDFMAHYPRVRGGRLVA